MNTLFTIKSLSSDREHTGTIADLVNFVNNHRDCRAGDYTIKNAHYLNVNSDPNFKAWLKHRGYSFNIFGQAVEQGEK